MKAQTFTDIFKFNSCNDISDRFTTSGAVKSSTSDTFPHLPDNNRVAKTFDEILKFNPNHDSKGRFASAPGGGGAGKVIYPSNGTPYMDNMSYRCTNGSGPLSDYTGYGMFADNAPATDMYGDNLYTVNHNDLTDINDLKPKIAEAWDQAIENGTLSYNLESSMSEYDGKTIAEDFDPSDIVDGAGAWDMPELVVWAYNEGIFDGIAGVKTKDGAVVFDGSKTTKRDKDADVWGQDNEKESSVKQNKKESNQRTENPEYTSFIEQMAQKYGADSMYSEMTDEEFERYEHLELHRFDKSYKHTTGGRQFRIMKTDDDKRLIFGWASVAIKVDGEQVLDYQQDMIDPDDLEEAVYEYVLNFRDGGEEHIASLRKKARLVESCMFTKEKMKAMGIPEGIVPEGWWIGFYVDDDEAWKKVKSGIYQMFSIEGQGIREEIEE